MDKIYKHDDPINLYCKNCELDIPDKFCITCGGGGKDKFSIHQLKDDILEWLGWEKNFFRTFFLYLFKPKKVIQDYLKGKTNPYNKPIIYSGLVLTLNYYILERYNPKMNIDESNFTFLVLALGILIAWYLQNLLFFRKKKWSKKKHLYIILFTMFIFNCIALIENIIKHLILYGIFNVKINESNEWLVLTRFIIIASYSIYIPFCFINTSNIKKTIQIFFYFILGAFWFLVMTSVLSKTFPERNFANYKHLEAKPLFFVNDCFVDVNVCIAYQKNDGKWEHLKDINVKSNDSLILKSNGDTLKIANPTVYFYTYNNELDIEWSGDKPIIIDNKEYQAYEKKLYLYKEEFYYRINCNNSLIKKEREELKSKIGGYPTGFKIWTDSLNNNKGLKITYVYKGLSAEKAGLRVNDVIKQVDTFYIHNLKTLEKAFYNRQNDTVKIKYQRKGIEYSTGFIFKKYFQNEQEE